MRMTVPCGKSVAGVSLRTMHIMIALPLTIDAS
jgi:hypothetical protein